MKVAIMQPYFLPYIGYFQLIDAVDIFIVYDNIKYTKKGWINRNRMLQNGTDVIFSIPLKNASDYFCVCERELAADFNRSKLLNQIRAAYRKAPHFEQTYPLIELIVNYEESNLFKFIHHSITRTCQHLGVATEIRISSDIAIDHDLKSEAKVLALCKAVGASTYINSIGGLELYAQSSFKAEGIMLNFIQSKPFQYIQMGDSFIPWLSMMDVLMFNSLDDTRLAVKNNMELICN